MRFSYFHLLQPGGRLYSLIEIKAIKEVAVASITEQLSTGDFIKRCPDYVLFHKTNEGEITNFLGCFPSQPTVYTNFGQWSSQSLHG